MHLCTTGCLGVGTHYLSLGGSGFERQYNHRVWTTKGNKQNRMHQIVHLDMTLNRGEPALFLPPLEAEIMKKGEVGAEKTKGNKAKLKQR